MRISKMIAAMAVAMVAAQPVVATAARPASAAQKLSLKNSIPGDARVSGKPGQSKAISTGLILLVVAGVAGVVAVATSGKDATSK